MIDGEQLDLYPDPELNNEDPLKSLVLELAEKWKEKERKIDLIFFFSARDRYSSVLADLPEPMRAEGEISILKKIMAALDEAGIEFTKAQVNNRIKELDKISPKETKSGWEDRKDLY